MIEIILKRGIKKKTKGNNKYNKLKLRHVLVTWFWYALSGFSEEEDVEKEEEKEEDEEEDSFC